MVRRTCMVATVNGLPSNSDLMCALVEICLNDVKQKNVPLYIQFELLQKTSNVEQQSGSTHLEETTADISTDDEPADTITNFLMNRKNCFITLKTNAKHKDAQQYNAIVEFIKEKKCGVRSTSLADFETLIQKFSSMLWELDPHYSKIKQYAGKFSEVVETRLLGFNDPKSHGHSVKNINMATLLSKLSANIVT